MRFLLIQIDDRALNQAITRAFHETVQGLAAESKNQIAAPVWQWPRYTRRRNGKIAGLVRDRVDTGELYEADHLEIISDDEAAVVNDADHAAIVALGTSKMPGTNWMQAAIDASDPQAEFADNLRKRL